MLNIEPRTNGTGTQKSIDYKSKAAHWNVWDFLRNLTEPCWTFRITLRRYILQKVTMMGSAISPATRPVATRSTGRWILFFLFYRSPTRAPPYRQTWVKKWLSERAEREEEEETGIFHAHENEVSSATRTHFVSFHHTIQCFIFVSTLFCVH